MLATQPAAANLSAAESVSSMLSQETDPSCSCMYQISRADYMLQLASCLPRGAASLGQLFSIDKVRFTLKSARPSVCDRRLLYGKAHLSLPLSPRLFQECPIMLSSPCLSSCALIAAEISSISSRFRIRKREQKHGTNIPPFHH